jgi:hypothetical protein
MEIEVDIEIEIKIASETRNAKQQLEGTTKMTAHSRATGLPDLAGDLVGC